MSRKIAILFIALLVLSLFSSIALAHGKLRPISKEPAMGSADLPVLSSQSITEDKSRRYSLGELNSCVDVKLRRGDTISFSIDGQPLSIRQGIAGSRYMQLTLNGIINDRFYPGSYKQYDVDGDSKAELQIALYELMNGKTSLAVCELE